MYKVRPRWETKRGGSGTIDILDAVTLRDPDRQVPWAIVNESTPERLLTRRRLRHRRHRQGARHADPHARHLLARQPVGAVTGDDPLDRRVFEFDVRARRWPAGDLGLGDPFSFPYVTVEAVLPIGHDRLAFVNDTNFGSTGRNPALPDYSDFIGVEVPGLG